MPRWGVDEGRNACSRSEFTSRRRWAWRSSRSRSPSAARRSPQGAATRIGKLVSGSKIKRGSIPGNRLVKGGVDGRPHQEQLDHREADQREDARDRAAARRTAKRVSSRTARRTRSARPTPTTRSRSAAPPPPATSAFASRTIPSGTTVTGAFGIGSERHGRRHALDRSDPDDGHGRHRGRERPPAGRAAAGPGFRRPQRCHGELRPNAGTADADALVHRHAQPHRPPRRARSACTCRAAPAAGTVGRRPGDPGAGGKPPRIRRARHQRGTGVTGVFGTWAYTAP